MKTILRKLFVLLMLAFSSLFGAILATTPVFAELPPELAPYDLNNDGVISSEEAELIEAAQAIPGGGTTSSESNTGQPTNSNTELSDEAKKILDANGDGVISSEEAAAAEQLFGGIDENGNLIPKNDTPAADTSTINACQEATNALSWIICTSFQTAGGLVDDLYGAIEEILIVKPITTDSTSTIYQVWQKVRDITNVVFVIFILIVIYSQVTGVGISNYGIKRVLPRIIISAILVNLSFFVCALAVDVSNIIGSSIADFLGKIQNDISSTSSLTILTHINWGAFAGYLTGGAGIAGVSLIYAGGIKAVFWTVFVVLIGVVISVFIGIITIGLRQGVVAILIMIAPLAFVCYLLPNTEKWFEKWKSTLFQMLFFYPMFSFLFGASKLAGWAIMQGAINPDTLETDAFQVIIGLAIQVMPLFLAISLLKMSNTILGKISSGLDRFTAPFRNSVSMWGASHAEQKRQQYIRDAHILNGGRLRAYLQKRQKLREMDTAVNAAHNQDRATEYALTKQASSLKRDISGHARWRARPNAYTRAAKRADLQRLRTGVAQQNLANTLSEYGALFKDKSSQRLSTAAIEAFKDTAMQQYWAENIAQGDQSLLLNEYLNATKNRRRAPYEFNRLVHDAAGSMGHIGQATIMGQVIKRSAEIEARRRSEAAIMINKFNVSKTAFRGMVFDTAHMNDDGYEEDDNGVTIEDEHYNIKDGYQHQEWKHYLVIDKATGKEVSRAMYDSLSDREKENYKKVRYMEIGDDDNDTVQYVFEDDAGYMKEMLSNDIAIGDPINRRYAQSFGLPRFDDQRTELTNQFDEKLGHLRKYHSTVSSALRAAKYSEHDAAFTDMLISQINSGFITSPSQLNIARLDSLRLTGKTGKIVQNDPIILQEYADILNCLTTTEVGKRFEDYFTDEAIANYRNVNGLRLHGLRLSVGEDGVTPIWEKIDRNREDLTIEDQRNYIKHFLIPRTAKKLMGALNRNLSPTALDNLKPEGVDSIDNMISNIEQLEASNRDESLTFAERANPDINIFESADPKGIRDRIEAAKNRFYNNGDETNDGATQGKRRGRGGGGYQGGNRQGGQGGYRNDDGDGYTDGYTDDGYTGANAVNERLENEGYRFNPTDERVSILEELDSLYNNHSNDLGRFCNDLQNLVESRPILRSHRAQAYQIIEFYRHHSSYRSWTATDMHQDDDIVSLYHEFYRFVENIPELNA